MPDVPEHLVKLPTYSRRFHGLGKFYIFHEVSNWYYTWASLIRVSAESEYDRELSLTIRRTATGP